MNKPVIKVVLLSLCAISWIIFNAGLAVADWLDSKQTDTLVYFLFDSPARIETYDLNSETWQETIPFSQNPTAFHIDNEYLYVAYGTSVYRYNIDGSGETFLKSFTANIHALFSEENFLFVFQLGRLSVIDRINAEIINENDSYAFRYFRTGVSHAPTTNALFGRSTGISPGDIGKITYSDSGQIIIPNRVDSPYHQEYPMADKTWVFQDNTKVVDSAGIIYNGFSLEYINSFGSPIDDIEFFEDGASIVLQDNYIKRFSPEFLETGSTELSIQPQSIYLRTDDVAVFFPASEATKGIGVAFVPLVDIIAEEPGPVFDPSLIAFTPDDAFIGSENVLFLLSKAHASIFRWNILTQEWLNSIPLLGSPDDIAYSAAINVIYTVYERKIKKIDPTDPTLKESSFVNLPENSAGMVCADEYLVTSDFSGDWLTHRVFDSEGSPLSYRDWNYRLDNAAWCHINQRIYHFRNGSSPNDIHWESINTEGGIAGWGDSPYHGDYRIVDPIRIKPDGSILLLGSGNIYNAGTLEILNTLSEEIIDATWLAESLYTLSSVNEIIRWSETDYQKRNIFSIPGSAYRLMTTKNNELLLIYINEDGYPILCILDGDYGIVPPSVIKSPVLIIADSSASSLSIRWGTVFGSEQLILERKNGIDGVWEIIANLGMGETSFEDTNLNSNTVYYYRAKALNGNQESVFSNELEARTLPIIDLAFADAKPFSGNDSVTINYFVNYFNEAGNTPTTKLVYIDDVPYEMNLLSGLASDGVYQYQTTLDIGTHTCYLYFSDETGAFDRLPDEGSYTGPYISNTVSLGDALDNSALTWSTSGEQGWFGQGNIFNSNGSAAQSGAINDNGISSVTTIVTGPKKISFIWKVLSEEGYDFLRFYIDGVKQAEISGDIVEVKEFYIKEGEHTLTWSYEKDESFYFSYDAGWIDDIVLYDWNPSILPIINLLLLEQ